MDLIGTQLSAGVSGIALLLKCVREVIIGTILLAIVKLIVPKRRFANPVITGILAAVPARKSVHNQMLVLEESIGPTGLVNVFLNGNLYG